MRLDTSKCKWESGIKLGQDVGGSVIIVLSEEAYFSFLNSLGVHFPGSSFPIEICPIRANINSTFLKSKNIF